MPVSLRRAWRGGGGVLAAALLLVCLALGAQTPSSAPALAQEQQPAQAPETQQPPAQEAQPQAPVQQGPRDPALGKAERALEALRIDLAQTREAFARPSLGEQDLVAIRTRADDIRTRALSAQEELKVPLADRLQQLQKIGSTPAGQAEDATLAQTRQQLFDSAAALQAVNQQLGLLALEAEQFLSRVTERQRSGFFRRLLEPGRSILNPTLWGDAWSSAGTLLDRLAKLLSGWGRDLSSQGNPGILALGLFVIAALFLGYRITRRWLVARYVASQKPTKAIDDAQRLWRIVRGVLFAWAGMVAIIVVAYVALRTANALTPRFEQFFRAVADFFFYSVVMGVGAHRLASPGAPEYRVVNLDDQAAARFAFFATSAAVVSAGTDFLADLSGILFLPISASIAQSALAASLMTAIIILTILAARNHEGLPEDRGGVRLFAWANVLVPLVWFVLAVCVLALLAGYVALAAFLSQQVINTAFIVAGLLVVHHLTDAVVASSFDAQSPVGRFLRRVTGLGDRTVVRIGLLLRTVIDLSLVLVGLPLLFVNWAVTWIDVGSWTNAALQGIQIGDVTISLESILVGLVVLGIGLGMVKLFTLWLDRRVLVRTSLDAGVRNSIETGTSYVGMVLVAALALSSAGLDFSNLAIVAGALGVGIGFGLQSIVNNFVSGLILLAERPIKVGDWIKVTGGEGIVKRINVRSTEIETFDKCAIIVPNSSLITDSVSNWTHGDVMGRVMVAVGAGYGSDPRAVEKILLDCGKKHERILAFPQPFVRLQNFGGASLDFALYGYVADVGTVSETASDLRYEIIRRFQEAGIEMSYAQSDVRLKGFQGLADTLKENLPRPGKAPSRKDPT